MCFTFCVELGHLDIFYLYKFVAMVSVMVSHWSCKRFLINRCLFLLFCQNAGGVLMMMDGRMGVLRSMRTVGRWGIVFLWHRALPSVVCR